MARALCKHDYEIICKNEKGQRLLKEYDEIKEAGSDGMLTGTTLNIENTLKY